MLCGGDIVDYLREPPHGPHRIGAIAISGLAGYVLGMRRGKIRRILYGTMGMMGMAAICYPEEAKDCLEAVVLEGRRYFIIAYHFVCGESPEMPEWLEKFVGPKQPQTVIIVCFIIPEPIVAESESWEEVPVEEKPKARDCRCNPDPDDPQPCVLKCN